jgi:hypothetical protein
MSRFNPAFINKNGNVFVFKGNTIQSTRDYLLDNSIIMFDTLDPKKCNSGEICGEGEEAWDSEVLGEWYLSDDTLFIITSSPRLISILD